MKKVFFLLIGLLLYVIAEAQTLSLLKVIDTTTLGIVDAGYAHTLKIGNKVYFTQATTYPGGTYQKNGIWVTDGTETGTQFLHAFGNNSHIDYLTNMNGVAYFATSDNSSSSYNQLWKSDGTTEGTTLVKDFGTSTSITGASEKGFPTVSNNLFFNLNNGDLWKSDGTTEGTTLVKSGLNVSLYNISAAYNGNIYFLGTDATYGTELWKSDGTTTAMVKDITAGSNSSYIYALAVSGNKLFVFGYLNSLSSVWVSDGTTTGTIFLSNVGSNGDTKPVDVNGTLFFSGYQTNIGYELWKSDGTPGGTALVKDIYTGNTNSSNPRYLTNLNGVLYFSATTAENGAELWKSDGTAGGTVMVKDIVTGTAGSNPYSLFALGGLLYFGSSNGYNNYSILYKSDGTSGGTVSIKQIYPYNSNNTSFYSPLSGLVSLDDNKLLFYADDGDHGREIWKSDGTPSGTFMFKDINRLQKTSDTYLADTYLAYNHKLYFNSWQDLSPHGQERYTTNVRGLWESDGTEAGTVLKSNHNYPPSTNFLYNTLYANFEGIGEYIYINNKDDNNYFRIKRYNIVSGTIENVVGNDGSALSNNSYSYSPYYFKKSGNYLYFVSGSEELWRTDGTQEGTIKLKTFSSGLSSSWRPYYGRAYSTDAGGILFFSIYAGTGSELWKTDGTANGTVLVKSLGTNHQLENLCNVNGVLFFGLSGNSSNYTQGLYKSDGTAVGTVNIASAYPFFAYSYNGSLIFADGSNKLWKSDGTLAGTIKLSSTLTTGGNLGYTPAINYYGINKWGPMFTQLNGILYFAGGDSYSSPNALWRTDGTVSGTYLVKQISSNNGYVSIKELTAVGNKLYFVGQDDTHNEELYVSDGTSDGTGMLMDIFPGTPINDYNNPQNNTPNSSSPAGLTALDGSLYFEAYNQDYGRVLYKYTPVESTLPVRLASFSGKSISGKNILQWTTASETGSNGFAIERSSDGKAYAAIGFTAAKNAGNISQDYTFTDEKPLPGDNYYRLKITDLDGKTTYSDNVVHLALKAAATLKLYPNPAHGFINIETGEKGTLTVTDAAGKTVLSATPTGSGTLRLNVSKLPAGIYFYTLNGQKGSFVKQ